MQFAMPLLEVIFATVNWVTVALGSFVSLVIYAYFNWSRQPPGPVGLPFLGYYPFLSKKCHKELAEMTKKYGDVFCLNVTGQLYAHIGNMKAVREAHVTKADCFQIKPTTFSIFQDTFADGVFQQNGEEWRLMRKFFIRQFKEYGMGKRTQEGVVQNCLEKIVTRIRESKGRNFDGLHFFSELTTDVIKDMIFGDVKINEDDSRDFIDAYTIVTDFTQNEKLLVNGPILKYFFLKFKPEYRRYRKWLKRANAVIFKIIRQHERDFDPSNIRNMVDTFFNEKRLLQAKKDPNAKYFTERSLAGSIRQFFGDGVVGPAWISSSILKLLANHPFVQRKIQSEIDEVIGRNRYPSLDDKSMLFFTNAAIFEGTRMSEFFPLLPSLECTKEVTIGGCRIPEGTVTLLNHYSIYSDPRVYEEPNKFDPTRFLSTGGKKQKAEIPILFGVGKRACAGEPLASMEIFLYVATVLQNFDLLPALPDQTLNDEWTISFRATPRAS